MLGKPCAQPFVAFEPVLQALQRVKPCLRLGDLLLQCLHFAREFAFAFLRIGQALYRLRERFLFLFQVRGNTLRLALQTGQPLIVRLWQCSLLLQQAFAT